MLRMTVKLFKYRKYKRLLSRKTADFVDKDGFLYNLSTKTAVFVDNVDQYFSHQRFE